MDKLASQIKRNNNINKYFMQALDLTEESICRYNVCSNCNINMEVNGQNYVCPVCKIEFVIQGESFAYDGNAFKGGGGMHRINNGIGYGDYSVIQQRHIYHILSMRAKKCTKVNIPQYVLQSTAKFYNEIQQISINLYDGENKVCGKKKYLHRGNMLFKILAACLYITSAHSGLPFKPSEISIFMNIHGESFSNGTVELFRLSSLNLIELPPFRNVEYNFALRYLTSLGIVNYKGEELDNQSKIYINFIIGILNRAKEYNICMGSFRNSRVIGTIWILIDCTGIDKTVTELEEVCSRVKKNTFIKFANAVYGRINIFHDIFEVSGIRPPKRPKKLSWAAFP